MKTNSNYILSQLGPECYTSILSLRKLIYNRLEDKSILHIVPDEFIYQCLCEQGCIFGGFSGKELIAFQMLYFPHDDPRNCGIGLGLPQEELSKVVHLSMAGVHPDHRKNNLGSRLIELALKELATLSYPHVCATVAPNNPYIIRILMKRGLTASKLLEKYGGKLRYIMYRNLDSLNEPVYTNVIDVDSEDIDQQHALFDSGFEGFQQIKSDRGFKICFGQRAPGREYPLNALLQQDSRPSRIVISSSYSKDMTAVR